MAIDRGNKIFQILVRAIHVRWRKFAAGIAIGKIRRIENRVNDFLMVGSSLAQVTIEAFPSIAGVFWIRSMSGWDIGAAKVRSDGDIGPNSLVLPGCANAEVHGGRKSAAAVVGPWRLLPTDV